MKDNIQKFIDAQNAPGYAGYANAVTELTRGKKLSHWIWYVFPQLKSISQNSPYEKRYGIESIEEAREYLQDSTLRSRLDEVCNILMNHQGKTANSIFGMTDSAKVKSSMTLFYLASRNELYRQVLDKYFNGLPCQKTLYALNLTMPSRGNITSQNTTQRKESQIKHPTGSDFHKSQGPIHNNAKSNSSRKPSKARKAKKLVILLIGTLFIVGAFGGVGYGVYSLLTSEKQENPIAENVSPEIEKATVADKSLAIVLRSSDRDIIGREELEKYYIHVSASLGGETCVMDTTSNSYNFTYTGENANEAVILNAMIEDCAIGEATYVYNDLDASNDNVEESVTLNVSSSDLRIYEELAWYVSAKQQVSETKYPKYVERIKGVKDEQFATLLTKKLNSIGKTSPKPVEEKKEVSKKNDVALPNIIARIRNGVKVPRSQTEDLSPMQKHIIEEYNHFISSNFPKLDVEMRNRILKELRNCRTIEDLQYIIRKYHKCAER